MSAKAGKLFRESHRDARLRQFHAGHNEHEVRPLSLTLPESKIIKIKDTIPANERKR
jgi:hypothetical protein